MKAFAKVLVTTVALSTVVASVSFAQRPPRDGGGQELGGTSRNGGPGTPVGHSGGGGSSSGGDGVWGATQGRPDRDSGSSSSSWDSPSWRDRDTSWSRDRRHDHDHDSSSSTSYVYCAPETVNSNVKATDKTLKALSSSSTFSSAKKFNATVAKIAAWKNPNQKAAAYLDMVGIDAGNAKAVVEFLGAREARGSWLVELQKTSDLTEKQAEQVASAMQATLRGGLQ